MKRKLIVAMLLIASVAAMYSCARRRPFPPEIITVTGSGYAKPPEGAKPAPVEQPAPEQVTVPDWSGKEIEAVGQGAPPPEAANPAQSRLMAKLAAKRDAQRNLVETLNGVQIDSKTTVRDFVTQNDEIRSKVDAFLKGCRVVEEKENADGSWEVRVAVGLEPLREIIAAQEAEHKASTPPRVTGKSPLAGQDLLLARRAAEIDARRKLLEFVKGARIDSFTTVEDFMTKDDRIRSEVQGFVAGAHVMDTRYFDDGTCEVDIQFDLSQVKNLVR
jgi:hypothetical protein